MFLYVSHDSGEEVLAYWDLNLLSGVDFKGTAPKWPISMMHTVMYDGCLREYGIRQFFTTGQKD